MTRSLILLTFLQLAVLASTTCLAQDRPTGDGPEMSRAEWQAQLKASRERADLMRRERKGGYVDQAPSPDDIAEEASRRVLEDDSLLPGDVVSTRRGLFRFQGAPDRERRPDDFVPIH